MEIEFIEKDEKITKKIIKKLSDTLDELLNKTKIIKDDNMLFMDKFMPDISIDKYLIRIDKYFNTSYTIFILLPYFLDKIILNRQYNITFNKNIIHNILITIFVILTKKYEDLHYSNKYYAAVGGLELNKLNEYELKILKILDYDLNIQTDIYEKYKKNLIE